MASSEKQALANIVIRNLPETKRMNAGEYIHKAHEIGGYKIAPIVTTSQPVVKYWWNESNSTKIILPEYVDKAFNNLANEQRGDPESAMLQASALCSGILASVLEHVGDLTHRMAQSPNFFQGGEEYVAEKVKKCLRWLTNPYGFAKEVEENVKANYDYYKENGTTALSYNEYITKLKGLTKEYSAAHRKLVVFNRAQWLAREAAVAVGLQQYSFAISYLYELKDHLDKGDWSQFALEYKLNEQRQLLPYKP